MNAYSVWLAASSRYPRILFMMLLFTLMYTLMYGLMRRLGCSNVGHQFGKMMYGNDPIIVLMCSVVITFLIPSNMTSMFIWHFAWGPINQSTKPTNSQSINQSTSMTTVQLDNESGDNSINQSVSKPNNQSKSQSSTSSMTNQLIPHFDPTSLRSWRDLIVDMLQSLIPSWWPRFIKVARRLFNRCSNSSCLSKDQSISPSINGMNDSTESYHSLDMSELSSYDSDDQSNNQSTNHSPASHSINQHHHQNMQGHVSIDYNLVARSTYQSLNQSTDHPISAIIPSNQSIDMSMEQSSKLSHKEFYRKSVSVDQPSKHPPVNPITSPSVNPSVNPSIKSIITRACNLVLCPVVYFVTPKTIYRSINQSLAIDAVFNAGQLIVPGLQMGMIAINKYNKSINQLLLNLTGRVDWYMWLYPVSHAIQTANEFLLLPMYYQPIIRSTYSCNNQSTKQSINHSICRTSGQTDNQSFDSATTKHAHLTAHQALERFRLQSAGQSIHQSTTDVSLSRSINQPNSLLASLTPLSQSTSDPSIHSLEQTINQSSNKPCSRSSRSLVWVALISMTLVCVLPRFVPQFIFSLESCLLCEYFPVLTTFLLEVFGSWAVFPEWYVPVALFSLVTVLLLVDQVKHFRSTNQSTNQSLNESVRECHQRCRCKVLYVFLLCLLCGQETGMSLVLRVSTDMVLNSVRSVSMSSQVQTMCFFYAFMGWWQYLIRLTAHYALPGTSDIAVLFPIQLLEDVYSDLMFASLTPFSFWFFLMSCAQIFKLFLRDTDVFSETVLSCVRNARRLAISRKHGSIPNQSSNPTTQPSSNPATSNTSHPFSATISERSYRCRVMRHQNFMIELCAKIVVIAVIVSDLIPFGSNPTWMPLGLREQNDANNPTMPRLWIVLGLIYLVVAQCGAHLMVLKFIEWRENKSQQAVQPIHRPVSLTEATHLNNPVNETVDMAAACDSSHLEPDSPHDDTMSSQPAADSLQQRMLNEHWTRHCFFFFVCIIRLVPFLLVLVSSVLTISAQDRMLWQLCVTPLFTGWQLIDSMNKDY